MDQFGNEGGELECPVCGHIEDEDQFDWAADGDSRVCPSCGSIFNLDDF